MIPLHSRFAKHYRVLRGATMVLSACATAALLTGTLDATPIPANLGNGLDKLVNSNIAITNAKGSGLKFEGAVKGNDGQKYTDAETANLANLAIKNSDGRVLVRITLNGKATFNQTKKSMKAGVSSLTITSMDKNYRGIGIMNAYVDVADVPALAQTPGVAAVILELQPFTRKIKLNQALAAGGTNATVGETLTKIGTDFDQGVTQHRIDQISQTYNASAPVDYSGQGMTIACISNSYNAHTAKPATTDVTNFDLAWRVEQSLQHPAGVRPAGRPFRARPATTKAAACARSPTRWRRKRASASALLTRVKSVSRT